MSATLTHRPEAPASDQVPAPRKVRLWVPVVASAAVATAVAIGVVATGPTVDDGSHQLAETQRQTALAPVQAADVSSQAAEFQRQLALGASAAPVDGSVQFAETQRFLAAASSVTDTSHDVAELQRMQALDDTSWEHAELRRMADLDPTN